MQHLVLVIIAVIVVIANAAPIDTRQVIRQPRQQQVVVAPLPPATGSAIAFPTTGEQVGAAFPSLPIDVSPTFGNSDTSTSVVDTTTTTITTDGGLLPDHLTTDTGAPVAQTSTDTVTVSDTTTTTTTTATTPAPVDKNVDLDGNGVLSLNEVQFAAFTHHGLSSNVVADLFRQVDANGDQSLNSAEFNAIRPLVLAKAEDAAQRTLTQIDTDRNGLLNLTESQIYAFREYGIGAKDVERMFNMAATNGEDQLDAITFSKLRRRLRGMSIRLARQIMKLADKDVSGTIDATEAKQIAFEEEGISASDAAQMIASVDDDRDGVLNAPEFADFERITRAKAVENSKNALKIVDTDGSGSLTMDEAKSIAFQHYGFGDDVLGPFFAQADENENNELDAIEFVGFRFVIRSRAIRNAGIALHSIDTDNDGLVSLDEAEAIGMELDDMDARAVLELFRIADHDQNRQLDRVELADFLRLMRLRAIKTVTDNFRTYDTDRNGIITADELTRRAEQIWDVDSTVSQQLFDKVDHDKNAELSPGEIVDYRHEIRQFVKTRKATPIGIPIDSLPASVAVAASVSATGDQSTTTTLPFDTTQSSIDHSAVQNTETTTTGSVTIVNNAKVIEEQKTSIAENPIETTTTATGTTIDTKIEEIGTTTTTGPVVDSETTTHTGSLAIAEEIIQQTNGASDLTVTVDSATSPVAIDDATTTLIPSVVLHTESTIAAAGVAIAEIPSSDKIGNAPPHFEKSPIFHGLKSSQIGVAAQHDARPTSVVVKRP